MHKSIVKEQYIKKISLRLWMKVVLLIFLILMVLSVSPLITANILNEASKKSGLLPEVPFTTKLSFCVLTDEVSHADYEKGSILLVQKNPKLQVGDKILIQNKDLNLQQYEVQKAFVIGVVTKVNDKSYMAKIFSYETQETEVLDSKIAGKLTSEIPYIGLIYQNMLGLRGYVLFGAIPALALVLLFFILRLICFEEEKAELELENEAEDTDIDYQETTGDEEFPQSFETDQKQSDSVFQSGIVLEQGSVSLELESTPPVQNTTQNTSMKNGLVLNTNVQNNIVVSNNALDEKQKKRLEIIGKNNPSQMMEEISQKNEQLDQNIKTKEIQYITSENEDTMVRQLPKEQEKQTNKLLSADEIIALYRNNKPNENKPNEFDKIAKLYYDSNIEDYET